MSTTTTNAPASSTAKAPKSEVASATIVICIESGPLETQSLWFIESLRKWGGRFSQCPIIAVTPRRGLPLERSTMKTFEKLNVTWLNFPGSPEWSFYGPYNKPMALAAAEEVADTEFIVWMDSDILVVAEPSDFELEDGVDYLAHPSSCIYDVGSTGEGHAHDPFWVASLKGHGIDPETYPRIPTQPTEEGDMRMYWQAGAFSYRRSTRLGATFLQSTRDQMLLDISSQHSGTYFHEQVGLAVSVYRQGFNFEILDKSHNFPVNRIGFDRVDVDAIGQARVIHYFGSAWPDSFGEFIEIVRTARPDVTAWLEKRGPLTDTRSVFKRVAGRFLRHVRKGQSGRYAERCKVY